MHPNELTLSEYVDRTLGRDEHAQVARHLETCEACRLLVDDLREITRAAAALDPIAPPARVWGRIEQEIRGDRGQGGSARRQMRRWPRRGPGWRGGRAGARRVHRRAIRAGDAAGCRQRRAMRQRPRADRSGAEARRGALPEGDQRPGADRQLREPAFDADTAATLQKNLAVINQAIDESRAAVRAEPASQQAQHSLIENFKTKLALLQDTVALINELRAGNDAAAARIVSGS